MQDSFLLKKKLFQVLAEKGAKLMGAGNLEGIVDGRMKIGVSVAVPVPARIVRDLQTAPTKEYLEAYHSLNARLDEIVRSGAEFLKENGYEAIANTTDVVKKDSEWRTPLPQKTVATRAGLGWIGKSCLLVTKEYGSAVRLSSLLTDAPLPADVPINESHCRDCSVCVQKCPGGALTGARWKLGMEREELFCREVCKKTQLERMKKATGIETDLCGLFFAVCPFTRQYLERECRKEDEGKVS